MSGAEIGLAAPQRGRTATPAARLVYWNMLAPRSRPEAMADVLRPMTDLAERLHRQDKAFFYSRLVFEELVAGR